MDARGDDASPDDRSPADAAFASLVHRAGQGDAAALNELAGRYEAKVRVVARVLLGRPLRPYVDSVDLVQSVHQSLLIGLRNRAFDVSDPEKLTALAVMIVRRKVARYWRKMQWQQRLSIQGVRPDDDGPADAIACTPSTEPGPGDAMQTREQVRRLCRDVGDVDRQILERLSQGTDAATIAADLGLSHVAVRVRLTRLRERFRAEGLGSDLIP